MTPCANGCAEVDPYGWTVEVGCPVHDPDAQIRALRARIGAAQDLAERASRKGYDLDPYDVLSALAEVSSDTEAGGG